jgi:hypothetical protein
MLAREKDIWTIREIDFFLSSGEKPCCADTTLLFPLCRAFLLGATAPRGQGLPHCEGFTITLIHTTLDRTPLEE